MPLITGSIYLFGQILSFALPVALLISFATFFYRMGRSAPETAPTPSGSVAASGSASTGTAAPPATPPTVPPAEPTRPYSDL